MSERNLQSAIEADRAHIIHPLHHPSEHQAPKIWVKGEGSLITDLEGKTYIDGLSGLWNVNIGHGRRELAAAAAAQMEKMAFMPCYTGSSNLPAIELAERLASLTYPSINRFFFTSGGGESTESSIKTARFYWKAEGKPNKWKVISREWAYHGVTLAAMSATGMSAYWPMFEPRTPGFTHIKSPYPYFFNYEHEQSGRSGSPGIAAANLLEEAILKEGADTVAAFIAEPVQGAGGVIVPQEDYFKRIREICDKYDVLFIADEVITGFGRTGKWFALDHWGVEPDIMNFAKGVTSGYVPLGGIGISDEIARAIDGVEVSQRYMHAFTYSGHPTACAVALANLAYMEQNDLVAKAAETGAYLQRTLKALEAHPHVGETRGLGMMAAVELVEEKAARRRFDATLKIGEKFQARMTDLGIWSRINGDRYFIAPPLTTTKSEIDRIVEALDRALRATFA
ncbi:MAG: aminotransferase family protein [Syntrophales bacterium]